MQISIDVHPLARVAAFITVFPAPLAELPASTGPAALLRLDPAVPVPLARDEAVRSAVRDMLRHGGYKPTGRSKPASEYLVRAATDGTLESINPAVDACNAVSLHSGLPISVIDLELGEAPYRIGLAAPGDRYVFNLGGQEIDVSGLLCLFDDVGPCANAVRDAQRTKTRPETRRTLSVLWGVSGHEERLARAAAWYRSLLAEHTGANTADATVERAE